MAHRIWQDKHGRAVRRKRTRHGGRGFWTWSVPSAFKRAINREDRAADRRVVQRARYDEAAWDAFPPRFRRVLWEWW